MWHVGFLFPNQGLNLCALHWNDCISREAFT